MVIAGAVPENKVLDIPAWDVIGTPSHLTRRELGVINVAQTGEVIVDDTSHELGHLDGLYVGRGSGVRLKGDGAAFYLVSAPADVSHPLGHFSLTSVEPLELGDPRQANKRSLYRYVWGDGHPSCQLQFGVTVIAEGSVWNTMPPHVHDRRSEVYLYVLDDPAARVVHLMGKPGVTRHLVLADRQGVISPGWSIHAGAGTSSYAFIWAMAGENTDYADITPVALTEL
jgi:4-deoxy-L-threo-5-hexosulose-uronate ketol-isomerase